MKRILLKYAVLLLSILAYSHVWAQDRTITGKVISADDGSALPGVNVVIKGTTTGTTTTADGNYSIAVPGEATLVFSFIGLLTQEVMVGNKSIVDVQLASDVKQLSEVVVVGYGTQERKNLTGAVTSIGGESVSNLATPSFDQQLAGRAAGVQVTVPSGILGQAPRIRIRGTNSISSGASPLIVVDGVPILTGDQSFTTVNNPLGDINPNDIESFEVLKDGSATAIYGSRAANGVILITTKKGKVGKPRVSYDSYFGVANVTKRFDLLGAQDFVTIQNEKRANIGAPEVAALLTNADGSIVDTDWQDQVFRTGFQQNHAVSVGGGTELTTYFFSLGYTDQKGVAVGNNMQRATFRANVDQKVTKWLSLGTSMGLTRTKNDGLNTGANSLSGNVFSAIRMLPNVDVYNPDDVTGYNIDVTDRRALGRGANAEVISNGIPNIRFVVDKNKQRATNYRALGNVYAEAEITEGLRLRTQYGIDLLLNDDFRYWDPRHGDGYSSGGRVSRFFSNLFRWNWQNTLSYNKVIAQNHNIGAVVGVEFQKQTVNYFNGEGTQLAAPFFGQENIISGTAPTQTIDGDASLNGFDSYFGRINYGFRDKYLVSFTVRNDGISLLPKANRRGTFPGGSIGWRVSQEDFFKNTSFLEFISDLKFRASYAVVGNVDIGSSTFSEFPYLGTYEPAQYASQNGISFANTGNPGLQWESSKKSDIGVDLALFKDRVAVTFDYYQNNVDKLLLFAPTPLSYGVPGNGINKNVGSLRNEGVELRIVTTNIRNGAFNWTTDFNFSTNKNKILALNNNEDIINPYTITRVGESISAIYGYNFAGVNPVNGNPLYVKGDGTTIQGNIVDNLPGTPSNASQYFVYNPEAPADLSQPSTLSASTDRSILGISNPRWFGGISNSFTYKGFDFEFFFRFSGGNKIMNVTRQQQLQMDFVNNGTEILNRWQSEETPGDGQTPRLGNNTNFINLEGSATSRFVEKGDFLRLQNVSLGYTIPANLINKASISRLRVYAQVQNALLFTKYKGLDPEANSNINTTESNQNNQFGVDFNVNPPQRVFTFGLNLSF